MLKLLIRPMGGMAYVHGRLQSKQDVIKAIKLHGGECLIPVGNPIAGEFKSMSNSEAVSYIERVC